MGEEAVSGHPEVGSSKGLEEVKRKEYEKERPLGENTQVKEGGRNLQRNPYKG